jgi:fructose-1,6-bisphosphatase II
MERNLALEFVRVTEEAAIAAARWLGKGDKIAADKAAVDAMRSRFDNIEFNGEVVIGEGDKDEAPRLFIGEKLGTGKGPRIDIAIDPLEGTTLAAKGHPGAIAVLAAGPKGTLLNAPGTYMDQIAVGKEASGSIDITQPIHKNIKEVAAALNKDVDDVTVVVLERDRHKKLIENIRKTGCRTHLIDHGTVAAGLAAATPNNSVDMMVGIGGAPEAVLTAAGVKCFNGNVQGILKPHTEQFKQQAINMGFTDLNKIFTMEDLAKGDELQFVATGVSGGPFLKEVIFQGNTAATQSIVMRKKTGTIRYIDATHKD